MDNVVTVGKTTSSRPASLLEMTASHTSMRGDPDAIAAHLLQISNTPAEMKSAKSLLDLPPKIVQNPIANCLNYNDYVRFAEALQDTAIALPTITYMNERLNEGGIRGELKKDYSKRVLQKSFFRLNNMQYAILQPLCINRANDEMEGEIYIEQAYSTPMPGNNLQQFDKFTSCLADAERENNIAVWVKTMIGRFYIVLQRTTLGNFPHGKPLPAELITPRELVLILEKACWSDDDFGRACCAVLIKRTIETEQGAGTMKSEFQSMFDVVEDYMSPQRLSEMKLV